MSLAVKITRLASITISGLLIWWLMSLLQISELGWFAGLVTGAAIALFGFRHD